MALGQDVLDIVPFPRADPAVSGEETASGGALCGKHAICQVVLTEHLDVDPQFFDIIGGVDAVQDVMGLPLEPMEGDVEEIHPAVCQGILTEFPFMVCDYHGSRVGFPGLFGPGRLLQEHEGILHAVDSAEMTDVDTPCPGVVLAHCKEIVADPEHGGL